MKGKVPEERDVPEEGDVPEAGDVPEEEGVPEASYSFHPACNCSRQVMRK